MARQRKRRNLFDQRYAYIQLINGENIVCLLSKPKRIAVEYDEEGDPIEECVVYRFKHPYQKMEMVIGGRLQIMLHRWNAHLQSREFTIEDDTIMFKDLDPSPEFILRYLQSRLLQEDFGDDFPPDYDLIDVYRDYVEFMKRDPESYAELIREAKLAIKQIQEEDSRDEKECKNTSRPRRAKKKPSQESNTKPSSQQEQRNYRSRRNKKDKNGSSKSNAYFPEVYELLRNRIVGLFGEESTGWIFDQS